MIKRFEAEHPEYKFTWNIEAVSEGDAPTKIDSDTESAADVYMFNNDQLGTLMHFEALMKVGGSYKEQVLNDNSQTLVNTVTYMDGQIYGFPVANNTFFMYYNKDVYTQEDVRSLDIMLGKGVVSYPMSNAWYTGAFFTANGCTLFGPNGNDASAGIQFGGQKGYEATEKMIEVVNHPNFRNTGYGAQMMAYGEADATFSGWWDYEMLVQFYGDKLGVAPMPTIEINGMDCQMKAFAGSKCVGVNPDAENVQVAMMFAAFLASEESQLERYRIRGVIPAAKNLINHRLIAESELALAEIKTMTDGSVAQPSISEMNHYWGVMSTFAARLVNGEITMENYKEMVDRMNELMNDFSI